MKQVCLLCERTSLNHNLYCQETYCPAEMSPNMLEPGEWLGDIEIVRPVIVLRSSVLYEAIQQKRRLFLKVAHPGTHHKERLKREAEFLRDIQLANRQDKYLPVLLPSYVNQSLNKKTEPYGKIMLGGHLLYFFLFTHCEGEPLRDLLMKNPQLWLNHIGLMTISVANAIAFLHSKGKFHFGLSPEAVLVHFDEKENVPRVLLFDLGIMSDAQGMKSDWYNEFVAPAYLAPEFVSASSVRLDYRTDVYGIGLLLYELLVGEPAVPFKLRSDAEIYRLVLDSIQRIPMSRREDVPELAEIAVKAVQPQQSNRQESARALIKELRKFFGSVPDEKASRWPSLQTMLVIIGALLAVAFLFTLVVVSTRLF
ncbi:MAG: protein kinase [Caldilineaceae bacterium]